MKFYLIVSRGKHQGMPIPITVDLFLVGTAKECQLRTRLQGVGAQHCAFVTREKKVFVRDLDSGESTVVNGSAMSPGEEWPLHKGDRIEVGPFEFIIQFREKPLSQRDLEEWALRCLDRSAEGKVTEEDDDEGEPAFAPRTPAQAAASILDRLQARRGIVKGRLRIGREGLVTTVRFNDRYLVEEAEIGLVKKELYDNLNRPNLRVLLDFKNVTRMSTVAVMMIDELCSRLRDYGSKVALCRIRPEIRDITRSLALSNKVPVFPDKPSALAGSW
jgi:hypothetical protein